ATVTQDGTLSLDPTSGPGDNGTVASLAVHSVTPSGFTGDVSVAGPGAAHPGRITVADAAPTGVYEVTIRATDDCGATTDATLELRVPTAPTVAGESVTREQGAVAATSRIATVDDGETAAGALVVTATPPAGITISDVTNDAGEISADVAADCTAATGNHSVPIEVTDSDGYTASDVVTVEVVANAAPTLSYDDASVFVGDSIAIDPATGPSDHGVVAAVALHDVTPSGFSGAIDVAGPAAATPGRVAVTDSGPAGTYGVTVRATDDCGATTDASFTVTVDAAPDAGGPYELEEGQDLELDSSGPDGARVTWDLDDDGTFSDAEGTSPTVSWADLVSLGLDDGPLVAPIEARFEDAPSGAPAASAESTVTIANAAPTVGVETPEEALVSRPVTVELGFDDPSPVDDAASASYRVEWGDGTTDDFTGGGSATRSHTYSETGTYDVEVRATDKDGGASEVVSRSLEVVSAMVVDVPCGDGVMVHVVGSSDDDDVRVVGRGPGEAKVVLGGETLGSFSGVALVTIEAGGGDDVVESARLSPPMVVFGDAGDDRIVGSDAADTLVGGGGADEIAGDRGRDLVIAGQGRDLLDGGRAQDVLAAGPSVWDAPTDANMTALCRLQLEWTSRATRTVRIEHLEGTRPGGLNGDALVVVDGAARTMLDDASRDAVTGGPAPDWLLVNRAGPGTRDSFGVSGADVVDDL
ncbi:MAG TPA: PKD domain-containing protein, partial [Actinomycetota bacterium]|nr:PKD domain-containing protein [Actinomycetota bacterium]